MVYLFSALWEVGILLHEMRAKWNLPSTCSCQKTMNKFSQKNGINQVSTSIRERETKVEYNMEINIEYWQF